MGRLNMRRRLQCVDKLLLCTRHIVECEESADMDCERGNRRIWLRMAEEARGDALYWAVELWLCG